VRTVHKKALCRNVVFQIHFSRPGTGSVTDEATNKEELKFFAKKLLGIEFDNGMVGCRDDHYRVIGKNGLYATHPLYTLSELEATVQAELKK
jgi:hypothetical protein